MCRQWRDVFAENFDQQVNVEGLSNVVIKTFLPVLLIDVVITTECNNGELAMMILMYDLIFSVYD